MAAEKCMSSSLLLDQPYMADGGHRWGPSAGQLMAIETDALARALGASMYSNPVLLDATPSSSSRSSTFFPCSPSPTGSTSTFTVATPASSNRGSPFLPSRSASPRPTQPAPCPQPVAVVAGRVSKRKPRRSPSKRAEISYIEADPAVFMEMVQQMTGLGSAGIGMLPPPQQPLPVLPRQQPAVQTSDPQQFMLQPGMPTLDTSAGFAVDTVSVPAHHHHQEQILSAPGVIDDSLSFYLSELDECLGLTNFPEFPQHHQQQEPQPLLPCFPTLESWSD